MLGIVSYCAFGFGGAKNKKMKKSSEKFEIKAQQQMSEKRKSEEQDLDAYRKKVAKARETAAEKAFDTAKEPAPNNVKKNVGNYFTGTGNKQWFFPIAKDAQLPEDASTEKKEKFDKCKAALEEWMFFFSNYQKGEFFDGYLYPREFKHITPPQFSRDFIENADDVSDGDCTDDPKAWQDTEMEQRMIYLQENANYKQVVNEGIDHVLTLMGKLLFQ